jgi:hypothetical protein
MRKKFIEDICNQKYDSLKEDMHKIISEKVVSILEHKKVYAGKKFFSLNEADSDDKSWDRTLDYARQGRSAPTVSTHTGQEYSSVSNWASDVKDQLFGGKKPSRDDASLKAKEDQEKDFNKPVNFPSITMSGSSETENPISPSDDKSSRKPTPAPAQQNYAVGDPRRSGGRQTQGQDSNSGSGSTSPSPSRPESGDPRRSGGRQTQGQDSNSGSGSTSPSPSRPESKDDGIGFADVAAGAAALYGAKKGIKIGQNSAARAAAKRAAIPPKPFTPAAPRTPAASPTAPPAAPPAAPRTPAASPTAPATPTVSRDPKSGRWSKLTPSSSAAPPAAPATPTVSRDPKSGRWSKLTPSSSAAASAAKPGWLSAVKDLGSKVFGTAARVAGSVPSLAAQIALTPTDVADATIEGQKRRESEAEAMKKAQQQQNKEQKDKEEQDRAASSAVGAPFAPRARAGSSIDRINDAMRARAEAEAKASETPKPESPTAQRQRQDAAARDLAIQQARRLRTDTLSTP